MRIFLLLFVLGITVPAFAQGNVVRYDQLDGTWEWVAIIDTNGVKHPLTDSLALSITGTSPAPADKWTITFNEKGVKCMVCGGAVTTTTQGEAMLLELTMDCLRMGAQCFMREGAFLIDDVFNTMYFAEGWEEGEVAKRLLVLQRITP